MSPKNTLTVSTTSTLMRRNKGDMSAMSLNQLRNFQICSKPTPHPPWEEVEDSEADSVAAEEAATEEEVASEAEAEIILEDHRITLEDLTPGMAETVMVVLVMVEVMGMVAPMEVIQRTVLRTVQDRVHMEDLEILEEETVTKPITRAAL